MIRRVLSATVLLGTFAYCGGGSNEGSGEPAATATESQSTGAETAPPPRTPPEPDVDGAEAQRLVAEGAFLLDVSGPQRQEQSLIEGATQIPLFELEHRMDEVPRDRTVIVYCFGGQGSPRAGQMLRDAGYTSVRILGARSRWDEAASPADPASP